MTFIHKMGGLMSKRRSLSSSNMSDTDIVEDSNDVSSNNISNVDYTPINITLVSTTDTRSAKNVCVISFLQSR
jgi:hypothetical protein